MPPRFSFYSACEPVLRPEPERETDLRRTKIVCTIGPSSHKRAVIEKLLRAGMDVARLNFSHGTHAEHAQAITDLREIAAKLGRPLALLQDLSGPKVRLGLFPVPSVLLRRGQEVGFTERVEGDADMSAASALEAWQKRTGDTLMLPLPLPPLIAALKPNAQLLLDDGKIALRVVRCIGEPGDPNRVIWAKCIVGGELKPRKGVTAPGVKFNVPAITAKDLDDLQFGLEQGVDWVAASYVRSVEDLEPLFELMGRLGRKAPLIAKIEKAEAVHNLSSLLKVVDGIMVARGDLGVEMPFDEVPIVQKSIIMACNRAGKPVITATQMLESMIQNPRPTRAEATDVANAILDGTDAVMLSGETAAGQFPVEAVQTMAKIAIRAEAALFEDIDFARRLPAPKGVTEAVARASATIAEEIRAKAILCATTSGGTALQVAQHRPRVPIIGVTTEEKTYRRLALTWGVQPLLVQRVHNTDAMLQVTVEAAHKAHLVKNGDKVVLTAGVPVNNPGTTNLIQVHTIGQDFDPPSVEN
jgi:pyruvate kinase